MVYKHVCLNILLLLHSAFMLCVVKMLLKGEVGGCALNSHGNYINDHGLSWKNHGIVFLNFCGNPVIRRFFEPHGMAPCSCLCKPLISADQNSQVNTLTQSSAFLVC